MTTHICKAELPSATDSRWSVKNLRRAPIGEGLVPVGAPRLITNAKGTPLASWTHADNRVTHFYQSSERTLWAITEGRGATPVAVGELPAPATSAITAAGAILIFTPAGVCTVTLSPDEEWRLRPAHPDFPAVAIHHSQTRTYSTLTPALNLTGSYSTWPTPMTKADIALLSQTIADAMRSNAESAAADGMAYAPLIVRYRLLDAASRPLYTSIPRMVTPCGVQGAASTEVSIALSGGSYRNIAPISIPLTAYRLTLSAELSRVAAVDCSAVTSLQLLVTPMIDLIDYGAKMYLSPLASSNSEARLRASRTLCMTPEAAIPAMLDRLDTLSTVAATLPNPFAPDSPLTSGGWTPTLTVNPDIVGAQTALLRSLRTPVKPSAVSPLMRLTASPHTFTAATAAVAGDVVALGDITAIAALPPTAQQLCTPAPSIGEWSAKVRLTLRNDCGLTEELCVETAGTDFAPSLLPSMVTYPHPGATLLEMQITSGDVTRSFSCHLTPTPDGTAACWTAPQLTPRAVAALPVATEQFIPFTKRHSSRHSSALFVAPTDTPLLPVASATVGSGTLTAIAESPRASQSIAFGRKHLYAFTSAGTHAVSLSQAMAIAVSPLHPASVTSAACVASAPGSLYAATRDAVLRFTGGSAVTVAARGRFKAIAYSSTFDELWCLPADTATPSPLIVDALGGIFTRTDVTPIGFTLLGAQQMIISTATGLYNPSIETSSAVRPVSVHWSRRLTLPGRYAPTVTAAEVALESPEADISLDLLADDGGPTPWRFAGLAVKGDIAAPPFLPVIARPYRHVTVTLSGTLHPASTITDFTLTLSPRLGSVFGW